MNDLREKIRLEICKYDGDSRQPGEVADSILAIPEIVEWRAKASRWDKACMDALDD